MDQIDEAPKPQITELNHNLFPQTKTFNKLMQFISDLQNSLFEIVPPHPPVTHPILLEIQDLLLSTRQLLINTPALENQPLRYGNPAFRCFYSGLKELTQLSNLPKYKEFIVYYQEAFGNSQRIDYGTGHELNFILFLLCIHELGYIEKKDALSAVQVFNQYINLVRDIQLQYRLEPAGSHGVWGIDDYQFLPFLFGAAELVNNEDVPNPEDGIQDSYLKHYGDKYIYLQGIQFIKKVKKGVTFHECSPILYDISGAASWLKVARGMVKMYQAEVLFKLPIARHIMFGSILPYQ